MNIVIFTNTFSPHVGGVARSIEAFTEAYRQRGHRVLIVAPVFPDSPAVEADVVRIPAVQRFNATDFSVALPLHPGLSKRLDQFEPDIIHAQHPFLLGMSALRTARYRHLPLVFTHHTLYERYTHYVPGDSPALQRFAIELATRYANACEHVFAPSESIGHVLANRRVTTPITVLPTGVRLDRFRDGDGERWRRRLGIPHDAFVIGHLGRLAPEKNLTFLARAMANALQEEPRIHALIVGSGPSAPLLSNCFEQAGLKSRLHLAGVLGGRDLVDALHAMDLFAFASTSETQGMVLTEAMATGLPVVALDAPGVREVVRDGINGRLLDAATPGEFAAVLASMATIESTRFAALRQAALATAEAFAMPRMADRALRCYEALISAWRNGSAKEDGEDVMAWLRAEWAILKALVQIGGHALASDAADDSEAAS